MEMGNVLAFVDPQGLNGEPIPPEDTRQQYPLAPIPSSPERPAPVILGTGAATMPRERTKVPLTPWQDQYQQSHGLTDQQMEEQLAEWERERRRANGPQMQADPLAEALAEKAEILRLARKWNKTAPGWQKRSYECYDQSKDMRKMIANKKQWKYWSFQLIGGQSIGVLGLFIRNHNVLEVDPIDPIGDGQLLKKLAPFTLDGFHGPQSWNVSRCVKEGSVEDFKEEYPLPVDQE
jgi:hypothetical protein